MIDYYDFHEFEAGIMFVFYDEPRYLTHQEVYDLVKLALMILNNAAMCHAIHEIKAVSND